MSQEQFQSPENKPSIIEEELIKALDSRAGIWDPEIKEMYDRYRAQCQAEADAEAASNPESDETSNQANIKAEIKIANLLAQTKRYKEEAITCYQQASGTADQNESTRNLVDKIDALIKVLRKR